MILLSHKSDYAVCSAHTSVARALALMRRKLNWILAFVRLNLIKNAMIFRNMLCKIHKVFAMSYNLFKKRKSLFLLFIHHTMESIHIAIWNSDCSPKWQPSIHMYWEKKLIIYKVLRRLVSSHKTCSKDAYPYCSERLI